MCITFGRWRHSLRNLTQDFAPGGGGWLELSAVNFVIKKIDFYTVHLGFKCAFRPSVPAAITRMN